MFDWGVFMMRRRQNLERITDRTADWITDRIKEEKNSFKEKKLNRLYKQ